MILHKRNVSGLPHPAYLEVAVSGVGGQLDVHGSRPPAGLGRLQTPSTGLRHSYFNWKVPESGARSVGRLLALRASLSGTFFQTLPGALFIFAQLSTDADSDLQEGKIW